MSRRRLLIFGINYAPEETGIALNTTGLAEGLAAQGWDVTAVAGIPHYPSWRPQPIPPSSPNDTVRLIRRRHYVPSEQSAIKRGAYELSWFASCLPVLLAPRDVDVVLGVSPSLGGAALAVAAAARYRIPSVLLIQDLVGRAAEQSGIHGGHHVAGLVQRIERHLARRAQIVGIVGEGLRAFYVEGGVATERIMRFRNPARLEPPIESRECVRARLGWPEDRFVALYTGAMGYKQGLENVVQAAALARDDCNLHFILQGDGNQRSHLEALTDRLDLPNVTFAPLAPAREFSSRLAAADVLLLSQRGTVRNMAFPAKLAQYFASGVPVVASVAAEDEIVAEIRLAGAGIAVEPDQPRLLLEAIRRIAQLPDNGQSLGAAGMRFAEENLGVAASLRGLTDLLEQARSFKSVVSTNKGVVA